MREQQNSPRPAAGETGLPVADTVGSVDFRADPDPDPIDAANRVALDIAAMRAEYSGDPDLTESWLDDGWESLLRNWIEFATVAGITEPNAMVLATVEMTDGGPRPASRTVLCKGLSAEGVTFYTNYDSDKGEQLHAVPYAASTFSWPKLGRQVTLRGRVDQVPSEVTTVYWRSRPRNSQLGAWASHQSRPVASRAELDRALSDVIARFEGVEQIPVPANWGGYILRPETVEFWQGRRSRLHNRIRVTLPTGGASAETARVERLQP